MSDEKRDFCKLLSDAVNEEEAAPLMYSDVIITADNVPEFNETTKNNIASLVNAIISEEQNHQTMLKEAINKYCKE